MRTASVRNVFSTISGDNEDAVTVAAPSTPLLPLLPGAVRLPSMATIRDNNSLLTGPHHSPEHGHHPLEDDNDNAQK